MTTGIRQKFFRGVICCTGWLLFFVLASLVLPRVCRHFHVQLPALQGDNWKQIVDSKKATLARPWLDDRPLIIMAGDSHVEMGDWYGCFGGAFAVRNCGLSRATIEDVTDLVPAIADRNPKACVLICGVNNLLQADSIESCINLYQQLLSVVRSTLNPQTILVISVMPLRASALDRDARNANEKIARFDLNLSRLCQKNNTVFVDANPLLVNSAGGLDASLTMDGLHLNQAGYDRVASILLPFLSRIPEINGHANHAH